MRTIYFDYNSTTPLDAAVREAMMPFLGDLWGNPSSVHRLGQQTRAVLDDARDRVAHALGAKPSEIIFTSGGTEANNLAILGTARLLKSKGRHLITSAIEHHAVLNCFEYLAAKEGFEVSKLPVDEYGRVSPEDLVRAIRKDTTLVSIMAANNEIGSLQPVAALGAICRERGVIFHTDAVQWFGKEPVGGIRQFNADLVSVCAHKFHGPKGAGLLYIRAPLHPDPILFGGSQENERRAGTENLAGIVGLVQALELFALSHRPVFDRDQLSKLTTRLETTLVSFQNVKIIGKQPYRLVNTVAFVVQGQDSMTLLANLDLNGICASSGAACSAGSLEPSHVVAAIEPLKSHANSLIRLSLGRENTEEEVDYTSSIFKKILG